MFTFSLVKILNIHEKQFQIIFIMKIWLWRVERNCAAKYNKETEKSIHKAEVIMLINLIALSFK